MVVIGTVMAADLVMVAGVAASGAVMAATLVVVEAGVVVGGASDTVA